ncbi:ABC transporter permease [Salinicoccus carnicancri]|uniref:ABC transporter permease n=1 Tax=Salinicoccus carnicancri TaxID=558170 RepID=UPI0002DB64B1|nr:ABC transporter permease [Salinicoccus carnicancri]
MPDNLFRPRVNEDIRRRSYYGKFIFNSHFLIFLTIAGGVFIYSLLGILQTLEPSVWLDLIASAVVALFLLPGYRSLLKPADGIFLLPYETHMGTYLKNAGRYSLMLGISKAVTAAVIALLLLTVGHGAIGIMLFLLLALIHYTVNFHVRKRVINTGISISLMTVILFVMDVLSLILVLQHPVWLILSLVFLLAADRYVKGREHPAFDWNAYIEHEEVQLNRYYRNVSMFTNVNHIDKQFKRRKYLDPLLWKPAGMSFGKEKMYEFLFYRTFARDHDLPMIILRLIILFGIVMVWMGNLYVSIVTGLFGIYVIVLQMSQIYSAQAYLLWPKVWPVDRSFIQKSYVTFSHKAVFAVTLVFGIIFAIVHPGFAYIAFVFPLWGYLTNRVFSRAVYKKEQELSD